MRNGKIEVYHKGYFLTLDRINYNKNSNPVGGRGLSTAIDPNEWHRAGSETYFIQAQGKIFDPKTEEDRKIYRKHDAEVEGTTINTIDYIVDKYNIDIVVMNNSQIIIKTPCITKFEEKKTTEGLKTGFYE